MIQSRPIRILHVLHRMDYGGVENWLMNLLRLMDRTHLQFDFLVHGLPGAHEAEIERLGGRIIRAGDPHHLWSYRKRLLEVLREHGPYDVVHSHLHSYSGWVLRAAAAAGIPKRIAHSHTVSPRERAWWRGCYTWMMQRWIHIHATVGLATSQPALTSLFGDDRDGRWRVLHCGIDIDRFVRCRRDPAVRQQLGVPQEARLIGHVGRLVPEKNHHFMLHIAAACPKAWFVFIGDGPLHESLQELAQSLGVADRIIFAGARPDVPELLKNMDVFLFPSLREGLGLAMVEAQAAGLPVIHVDSIPRDAVVIPELCHALSLTEPVPIWAQRLMAARAPAGLDPHQRLKDSSFHQTTGLTRLVAIYQGAG